MGHWVVRSLGHRGSRIIPVACFLLALLLCGYMAQGQGILPSASSAKVSKRTVRLVAVGDINLAAPMARLMKQKGRDYPFAALKSVLQKADIAFANLECSVATVGTPIEKQFTFRADPQVLPVRTV